jgi:RimJ/RimL family protein N-acetyltransferase
MAPLARSVSLRAVEVSPPDRPLTDGVVSLRRWEMGDVPALVDAIDGDPEISNYLELIPQPYRENEARLWVDAAAVMWTDGSASPFAALAEGRVVGGAGVNWIDRGDAVGDIGYWLRQDARGRGYTTRAVLLLARWAFDLGCERLQIRADTANGASMKVAERAGFQREGVLRSIRFNPRLGRRMNFALYSLLPDELDRQPSSAN